MAPGVWYDMGELRALLPEYAFMSVRPWSLGLVRAGLAERGLNAEYDAALGGGQSESRYFYRLTSLGAAKASAWRLLLKPTIG